MDTVMIIAREISDFRVFHARHSFFGAHVGQLDHCRPRFYSIHLGRFLTQAVSREHFLEWNALFVKRSM